jgi:signal transduction histidine kinase
MRDWLNTISARMLTALGATAIAGVVLCCAVATVIAPMVLDPLFFDLVESRAKHLSLEYRSLVAIGDWYSVSRKLQSANTSMGGAGEAVILPAGTEIALPENAHLSEEIRNNHALLARIWQCGRREGNCASGVLGQTNILRDQSFAKGVLFVAPIDASMRAEDQNMAVVFLDRSYFADKVQIIIGIIVATMVIVFIGVGTFLFFALRRNLVAPIEHLARLLSTDGRSPSAFADPIQASEIREITLIRSAIGDALSEINKQNEERRLIEARKAEADRNAAIAGMTQMLAHDVRRPFSILRIGMAMLKKAADHSEVKRVLQRLSPEIDKATGSVDGLIADVMEIGSSQTRLSSEPTEPESLISLALTDVARLFPGAIVRIDYDLDHRTDTYVDSRKAGRVFSNIFANAVQAMQGKGKLWIRTRSVGSDIEFCLGNDGSTIPEGHLQRLFDAFFTSGKKDGTGLGLAIAHKVVVAHGGTIRCESRTTPAHPNGMVEFFFTLPSARTRSVSNVVLHSELSSYLPIVT